MGEAAGQRTVQQLIEAAGLTEAFGDETSAFVRCLDCAADPADGVNIRLEENTAVCTSCALSMPADAYLRAVAEARKPRPPARQTELDLRDGAGENVVALRPADPQGNLPGEGTTMQAAGLDRAGAGTVSDAALQPPPQPAQVAAAPSRTPLGEVLIIGCLALASVVAGLMAAGLSAWANHQAFGAMVEDPLQSQVWAWTGVIASICSFGGFTFVYWHFSAGRRKEGLRAIAFALAGAVTSIVGTEMFMANLDMARLADAEAAAARRPVLEAQVADWRAQLEGIPAGTRTVEGLRAYIAEVERVGRADQKPYRDAKVELGLAERRAALEDAIEAARTELLTLGEETLQPASRRRIPSLFFAVMLEVFASQGTSVGLVALLILLGNSRRTGTA